MKNKLTFEVLESLLCYFEYGDKSDITDNELKLLEQFNKSYRYINYDETKGKSFTKCDIIKLYGDCVFITVETR